MRISRLVQHCVLLALMSPWPAWGLSVNCDGAPTEPARIYCRAIWMADAALCESLPAQSGGLQCLAEVTAQIGLCSGIQYAIERSGCERLLRRQAQARIACESFNQAHGSRALRHDVRQRACSHPMVTQLWMPRLQSLISTMTTTSTPASRS